MKKVLFTLALSSLSFFAMAQESVEFGYNIGFGSYLGDLQTQDFTYRLPGIATGVFARKSFNSRLAGKLFMNYTRVQGDDAQTNKSDLVTRNLSFRSDIMEWGAVGEFNILNFDIFHPENNMSKKYYNFTPYVFAGLNLFYFNPQAYYKGSWVNLQPLETEGVNYSRMQIAIPFGLGFKFQISRTLAIGLEMGARKTFTDYLDDVSSNYMDPAQLESRSGAVARDLAFRSDELTNYVGAEPVAGTQRGNSNNKDWYLINTLSLTYKLRLRGKF